MSSRRSLPDDDAELVEVTLRMAAAFEDVSYVEVRRRALREAADAYLEVPELRAAVEAAMRSRRAHRRRRAVVPIAQGRER